MGRLASSILVFTLSLILSSSCLLASDAPLKVGLFYVPYYLESEKSGVFQKILVELSNMTKLPVEMKLYPAKRLLHKFQEREIHGFIPSVSDFRGEGVTETIPFYFKKDYFFYHLEKPIHQKLTLSICLTRGYPYTKDVLENKKYHITWADSDAGCFKMLNAKRVDALVCELITGIVTLERQQLNQIKIFPEQISSSPVSIAFRNDSVGKRYQEAYTRELKNLIASGVLKNDYYLFTRNLARKYGVDFNPLAR